MWSISNYYNWTAAIASNDSTAISNDPGTTPGSTNEFRRLNILYNSNSTDNASGLMPAPLYLSRSGRIDGGSLLYAGSSGYYWSSTAYSSELARHLYFYAANVNPDYNNYRYYGFSLRCVARR